MKNKIQEVIKKLRFKNSGVIINAPKEIEIAFEKPGFKTDIDKKGKSNNKLVFINNNKEYLDFLKKELKHIEPDSVSGLRRSPDLCMSVT